MQSIIQQDRECWACKTTLNLHRHHCIYGIANRRKAEEDGLTVYLCVRHHTEPHTGVHGGNRQLDLELKKEAQKAYERLHGHYAYMRRYHINYLEGDDGD